MREHEDISQPGDIMVLDYKRYGIKTLLVDGVITTIFRSTCLKKTSTTPGYAAKQAEDMKLYVDKASLKPVSTVHGGPHSPLGNGRWGRLGTCAQALLLDLACRVVKDGKHMRPLRLDSEGGVGKGEGATHVSLWVQK